MLFVRKATQDLIFSGKVIFKEGDILTLEGKDGLYFLKNSLGVGGFSSLEEVNEFTRELNNFEISALTEEMQQELLEKEIVEDTDIETEESITEAIYELGVELKKLTIARQTHLNAIDCIKDEQNEIKEEIDYLRSTLNASVNEETKKYSKQEIARMSFNDLLKTLNS